MRTCNVIKPGWTIVTGFKWLNKVWAIFAHWATWANMQLAKPAGLLHTRFGSCTKGKTEQVSETHRQGTKTAQTGFCLYSKHGQDPGQYQTGVGPHREMCRHTGQMWELCILCIQYMYVYIYIYLQFVYIFNSLKNVSVNFFIYSCKVGTQA